MGDEGLLGRRATRPGGIAGTAAARGTRGAVATPHVAATNAGMDALQAGGNAIDAALAAAAMLTVVYPHQCSIGGDAFALVAMPSGEVAAVNGSGRAPVALDARAVMAAHDRMPVTGPLAVTVPGVLGAWDRIHRMGGRLGLGRAFDAAAAVARDGAPVSRSLRIALELDASALVEVPGIRDTFFPAGQPLTEGEVFRQRALARTLHSLAANGVEGFYHGEAGARFIRGMRDAGSRLTLDDLARHETRIERPLTGRYRGHEVLTPAPNSQGFALLEILAVLEDAVTAFDPSGRDAPAVARLFGAVSADRDRYLADGDVPVDALLAADHIAELRRAMYVSPPEANPVRPSPLGRDTVAVCAADQEGWAVVLIQSLFHSFGARIMESATGIIVQNRGAAFVLDPDSPSCLAPGVRPPHTLTPVMVQHEGRLVCASGAMGGKAQPQIQAQILGRVLDLGLDAAAAVSAPRWVVGGLEVGSAEHVVRLEVRLSALRASFANEGFETELLGGFDEEVGHAQLISFVGNEFEAAADPRSDGAAAAW